MWALPERLNRPAQSAQPPSHQAGRQLGEESVEQTADPTVTAHESVSARGATTRLVVPPDRQPAPPTQSQTRARPGFARPRASVAYHRRSRDCAKIVVLDLDLEERDHAIACVRARIDQRTVPSVPGASSVMASPRCTTGRISEQSNRLEIGDAGVSRRLTRSIGGSSDQCVRDRRGARSPSSAVLLT